MRWILILERKSENALNPDTTRKHLKGIAAAAGRNKSLGFAARVGKLNDPEVMLEQGQERKRYLVRLRVEESKARTPEVAEERFLHVRGVIEKCARSKGWTVLTESDSQGQDSLAPVLAGPRPPFRPVELSAEVLAERFADVYDRDAQLRLINDAVQTHVLTGGELRAHTILYGLPGGCKSTLLERLKPLYDDADCERMVFMDATSMTKAGLENWLLERAETRSLPEIMVFEELEKVESKDNLMCLGSVMASGYLMKTNARIGRVQVACKFLVLATCNDEEALKAFRRGFLWDRFANRAYCPLPDRETMRRVLLDKVARIPGGRPCWADRALELADRLGVKTPRAIIGFLAGRHRLESGAYQLDSIRVFAAERREKASMQEAG